MSEMVSSYYNNLHMGINQKDWGRGFTSGPTAAISAYIMSLAQTSSYSRALASGSATVERVFDQWDLQRRMYDVEDAVDKLAELGDWDHLVAGHDAIDSYVRLRRVASEGRSPSSTPETPISLN